MVVTSTDLFSIGCAPTAFPLGKRTDKIKAKISIWERVCSKWTLGQTLTWGPDKDCCSIRQGSKQCFQIGRRNFASQPRPSRRFCSVNVPPCASAIWRLRTRPIPEPPCFVVKKGTKRFAVFEIPGPSSSTETSKKELYRDQVTFTPPPVSCAASAAL